jgi:hypothetical protein
MPVSVSTTRPARTAATMFRVGGRYPDDSTGVPVVVISTTRRTSRMSGWRGSWIATHTRPGVAEGMKYRPRWSLREPPASEPGIA